MKKALKWIVLVLVVIFLIVWFAGRFYLSFSVAQHDGMVRVTGVDDEVQIYYDSMAVPQVWAKTDKDLMFALGWLHASERLFQMELIRRVATGTLSEVFGPKALAFDLVQRKIGFARKAYADVQNMSSKEMELLKSYCDGINQWIMQKSVMPPEFVILGLTPPKWEPKHVAAIMLYQTWFAHYLMDHDRQYDELMKKLGKDIYGIISKYKNWSPSTVPFEKSPSFLATVSLNYNMGFASNSWAIAPGKSASGKPMHESDPHLQINTIPGFWYIVGLHSREGTNVLGVTVPSIPFVVMGHNSECAFAFTVASVDLNDYYRQKLSPTDSLSVLTPQGYKKMQIIPDSINVKGFEKAYKFNIYKTDVGSVIEKDSVSVLALKWAGYDFDVSEIIASGFKLAHVRNFSEFRRVVTSLGALDVNWTYSDKYGNIGYQLGAPIPIRDFKNTFVELPGEFAEYRWKGYRPLEETPFVFNPEQGFVATSNNQIVPPNWQYSIPGFYDPYRIVRVTELLKNTRKMGIERAERIQQDLISVKALRWKNLLAKGAEELGERALADSVRQWDGKMDVKSVPAGIFTAWWYFLTEEIFKDELGKDWKIGRFIVEEVLTNNYESVIDNKITKGHKETIEEISASALDSVLSKFGKVELGEISFHKLSHPLGVVRLLDYWLDLNRGPYKIGGDNSTIDANFNAYNEKEKEFDAIVGPSMRFLLDWANPDSFLIIGNLGQSGNPFSSHYADFLPFMQKGEYWNVPFSKSKVEKKAVSVLRIKKSGI